MTARQKSWKGMNWIRQEKRLAIYLRDGMACVYCGATVEDGARMSLDHIIPRSQGGTNAAVNLVTCCRRCNSSRADRTVAEFAMAVADYLNHGITARSIMEHIYTTTTHTLDLDAARAIIARRRDAGHTED